MNYYNTPIRIPVSIMSVQIWNLGREINASGFSLVKVSKGKLSRAVGIERVPTTSLPIHHSE
jgi:hypothetical protein